MNLIPRYVKINAVIFGILIPSLLVLHTILHLLNEEAIFVGRGSTVIYHGTEAYWVSLTWFGLSVHLFAQFLLGPFKLIALNKYRCILWLSALSMLLGLMAAIFAL